MVVILEHQGCVADAMAAVIEVMGLPAPPSPPERKVFCSLGEDIHDDQPGEHRREVSGPYADRMGEALRSIRYPDTDSLRAAIDAGLEAANAYLGLLIDDGILTPAEALDVAEETREQSYERIARDAGVDFDAG